jgi:hypothetical protein
VKDPSQPSGIDVLWTTPSEALGVQRNAPSFIDGY